MTQYLSAAAILGADDLAYEDVKVPEWADKKTGADTVRVKGLSGAQRDRFESQMMSARTSRGKSKQVNTDNFRARLVAASIVDDEGKRLFSDADVKALGEKSAAALDRVMTVAMRMSGLSDEDADELVGE